jgi:phosphatidylglycerol:prolipoprotein diacylglycerol transferase
VTAQHKLEETFCEVVSKRTRASFNGQVIASYGILYGTFRFFIEFLRGDPRGIVTLADITLSTSQAVSLILVPASLGLYLYLKQMDSQKIIDAPRGGRPNQ